MLVYAPSGTSSDPSCLTGAATFAECSRLFSRYPLAVMRHCGDGRIRSMILMSRAVTPAEFFVLTQARDDLFAIRSWSCHDGINQEIGPGEPVPGGVCELVADAMPIPHDGALLGWVADRRVTALLAVHSGQPTPPDVAVPVPQIHVMPMAGTSELDWPQFTASLLNDGRLWDYIERSHIVDIVPLVTRCARDAFWVPCSHGFSPGRGTGCVVVTANLVADEYWLPAGIYLDHWRLREGIPAPPASELLALPGTMDLADKLTEGV